jgi:hypothetical protein
MSLFFSVWLLVQFTHFPAGEGDSRFVTAALLSSLWPLALAGVVTAVVFAVQWVSDFFHRGGRSS